jgi:hypothetical protein
MKRRSSPWKTCRGLADSLPTQGDERRRLEEPLTEAVSSGVADSASGLETDERNGGAT